MGMFDEIRVEQPLPGPVGEQLANTTFQTKSFPDRLMDRFVIRDDRLYRQQAIHRRTGEFYEPAFTDHPVEKTKIIGWRDYLVSHVHGDIMLCDEAHDFLARFTEGKLTKLEYLGKPEQEFRYRGGCGIIRPDIPHRVFEDELE